MEQLIKITNHENKQAVSARELYNFLGFNKATWKRWYEKNIIKNPYAREGIDWEGFNIMLNGNQTKDFALNLDFAKRLTMLARTDKGEQARQYFIECERKLKSEQKELPINSDIVKAQTIAADWLFKTLNLNEASKLLISETIAKPLGLPIPNYVESKSVLKSATELLKNYDIGISSREFNKLMISKGLMVENSRQSTKKGVKTFKTLTKEGLEYGENLINPNNQKETQPAYYSNKFEKLIKILNVKQLILK